MNDIGKLFETKLNDAKKIPNKSLWEKINASLDEEKRRKKRVMFYWLLGGGLSFLLGLVMFFGNGVFQNEESLTQKGSTNAIKDLNTNSTKESNEKLSKILKEESLTIKKNKEEKLSKIDTHIENLKQNELATPSEKNSETKAKKFSSNKKPVDEAFTVSEKYYYYNSRDGKQLVTESKKEIDSIISKQYKSLDTITAKKVDSLE